MPAPANKNMIPTITPLRTLGNLCGSFIDSVIGMTKPMPSNEKTAVLYQFD